MLCAVSLDEDAFTLHSDQRGNARVTQLTFQTATQNGRKNARTTATDACTSVLCALQNDENDDNFKGRTELRTRLADREPNIFISTAGDN